MPGLVSRSSSSMNSRFTMRRMTSRGVKCSPAVSLESSEKRRIELLVEVAHLQVGDGLAGAGRSRRTSRPPGRAGRRGRAGRPGCARSNFSSTSAAPGEKAREVGVQVVGDVGRVVQQRRHRQRRGVVELLAAAACRSSGSRLSTLPASLVGDLQHLGLCRLQHAVEPAEHDERQDDPPVLGLLVVAPQQVGDRPDERRVVADGCAVTNGHGFPPCIPTSLHRS